MKFEVVNDKNKTVMVTNYIEYIPAEKELSSMYKAGYKFKENNKIISLKRALEIKKEK